MSLTEELLKLQSTDGYLSPQDVLGFARDNPQSECHQRYKAAGLWDDSKAAETARLDFARGLIQRYRVKITGNDDKPHFVRAVVSTLDSRGQDRGSYQLRTRVMTDEERRRQMEKDCAREVRSLATRYSDILSGDDLRTLESVAHRAEGGRQSPQKAIA